MRYRLRSLLIALTFGPPTIFYGWICLLCAVDGLRPTAQPVPVLTIVPTDRTSQRARSGSINVEPRIVIGSDDEESLAIEFPP